MKNYVKVIQHKTSLSVCFYIEHDNIMEIGDKLNKIHEEAYMNGYNWSAVVKHYLAKNHPVILKDMGSDPEAGMYVAYYPQHSEHQEKAKQLAGIIEDLVENEDKLFAFVREEGGSIEWD